MTREIKTNDLCIVIGAPEGAEENIGAMVTAREHTTCSCGASSWMVYDFSRPLVVSMMGPLVFYMENGAVLMHASCLLPIKDGDGNLYGERETEDAGPVAA